jgi:ribonucleoside-triphosphate reductase
MTGKSHTDGELGEQFGLKVMQALNDKCKQWKEAENIDYSLYGTPMESGTYKFAKALKQRFGEHIFIELDGKDRDYITNSYHIAVFEQVDPFEKLAIESKFQKLSPGGAISYIETCDLSKNIEAVLEVLTFIYDNIMYAELNTKFDYCQVCGYDGEINIVDENNSLIWECPNCGNRDKDKMNVARRTCGYIGTNFWNQGRTDEIAHRYVHMDDHDIKESE